MGGPKESETKKFLRKRAPFYIAGATLLLVFVVPEVTKSSLQDIIPDTLDAEERTALDRVLSYTGPNDTGWSIKDVVSDKIEEEYPDGNVYDHRSTTLDVVVTDTGAGSYRVVLNFESSGRALVFDWDVNVQTGEIRGNNGVAKDMVDLVNFYD